MLRRMSGGHPAASESIRKMTGYPTISEKSGCCLPMEKQKRGLHAAKKLPPGNGWQFFIRVGSEPKYVAARGFGDCR